MAHHVEPMDVDDVDSAFDNKENTYLHSNVLPCTEKGYEELDVSELNMKLRYSITPASSPMSKSYTACLDNRNLDSDDSLNLLNENGNLTRSLNSTMTRNDSVIKSLKALPLQALPAEQFVDSNRNTSVLRQLDTTVDTDNNNITLTIRGTNDIDENLSLPSSSSSNIDTPEATTPTKDSLKGDGGSPILRGLKTVLNMFRSSQSPIPPADDDHAVKQDVFSPAEDISTNVNSQSRSQAVASTPVAVHRSKDGNTSKRSSPYKESIVFNDDLEKELQWKDETTIIFSQEKIPIHKLFFQSAKSESRNTEKSVNEKQKESVINLNSTVEFMDVSVNDIDIRDKTIVEIPEFMDGSDQNVATESDSEFLDCETTFTKNESLLPDKIANEPTIHNMEDIQNCKLTEDTTEINITDDIHRINDSLTPNTACKKSDAEVTTSDTTNISEEQEQKVNNISYVELPESVSFIKCEEAQEQVSNILPKIVLPEPVAIIKPMEEAGEQAENILHNVVLPESVLFLKMEGQEQEKVVPSNVMLSESIAFIPTKEEVKEHVETILPDVVLPESVAFTKPEIGQEPENNVLPIELHPEPPAIIKPKEEEKDEQRQDILLNAVVPKSGGLDKPEELPVINYGKDKENIVEQVPTAENEPKISLEIASQKENTDNNCLTTEENIANNKLESKIEQSHVCTQNIDINDLLIPVKLDHFQDNEVEDIKIVEVQSNNNLLLRSEIDSLENNFDKTINVNDIANFQTLCDSNFKPPTQKICDPVAESTEKPIQFLIESAEQIKISEVQMDLPADIPLLPENDIETENIAVVGYLHNIDFLQGLCPDKLENMNTETALNNATSFPKTGTEPIVEENSIENITDKDNILPEIYSSNITIEKYEGTIIPHGDVLHAATDIESQNLLNLKNNSSQISGETQEIQSLNIDKSLTEIEVLPDVINQTINFTKLENVDEKADMTTEYTEQQPITPSPEDITKIALVPNILEMVSVSADTEIIKDKPPPNIFEHKNDISLNLSNDIREIDTIVNEINQSTCFKNEERISVFTEAVQDLEISKQTETQCPEKLINDISNEQQPQDTATDDKTTASGDSSPYVPGKSEMGEVAETKLIKHYEDVPKIPEPEEIMKQTEIPSSPPITSKGYNFNFDDLDDPFATKTKIRMSPTPETPNKLIETISDKNTEITAIPKKEMNKNRRRSQPERKKPNISRKKFNSTFDGARSVETSGNKIKSQLIKEDINQLTLESNTTESFNNEILVSSNKDDLKKHNDSNEILENSNKTFSENIPTVSEDVDLQIQVDFISTSSDHILETHTEMDNKSMDTTNMKNEIKTASSPELSTYYSAGASSNESIKSRNVFNLPEIDDMNFNPFATKSKMRQSPPPTMEICDPFASKSKIRCSPDSSMVGLSNEESQNTNITNIDLEEKKQLTASLDKNSEDKMETEPMEKDSSNMSNATSSSKATDDKNITVREVNTEDEDTIEGPFLEDVHHNVDKMSDIDGENIDMMQFNDLPPQETEENSEGGELFIDAEAFEFLLNQNKSNVVADSGKESLFLKFDPLFAKRISSDGVLADLNKLQKRQSTPKKTSNLPQQNDASPVAGPSTLNVTYEGDINRTRDSHEEFNVTVSKPTMAVTPAVNPVAAPRNKSLTPTKSNRRSILFTSPAMAVIDRLLSLSANNSLVEHDVTMAHVSREQNDADIALTQLRELLAEKENQVYNLRTESKELKDRLSTLESQMRILETDSQERLKKINKLNDRLVEKTKINKSMAAVVEEYERTIASLIAETEQDKKRHAEEKISLINERDEQTAHLASMEVSFSDLHSKYEKSKQVIFSCKANEDTYKKSIKEFQESFTKMQSNYELLKQHATSKLNHANQELEKMNRAHEAEVLKLNAMIKRKELNVTSLEETLAQKTKANEELAAICDELINKVG